MEVLSFLILIGEQAKSRNFQFTVGKRKIMWYPFPGIKIFRLEKRGKGVDQNVSSGISLIFLSRLENAGRKINEKEILF